MVINSTPEVPCHILGVNSLSTYLDLESNDAAKCKSLPDLPKLPERRKLSEALLRSGEAKTARKGSTNTSYKKNSSSCMFSLINVEKLTRSRSFGSGKRSHVVDKH